MTPELEKAARAGSPRQYLRGREEGVMAERSAIVEDTAEAIFDHMDQILAMFKPGAKITVAVRFPNLPERDLLLTSDDLTEVQKMCQRRLGAPPSPSSDSPERK